MPGVIARKAPGGRSAAPPLTGTVWDRTGGPLQVVSSGSKRLNVTVPVGTGVPFGPLIVAASPGARLCELVKPIGPFFVSVKVHVTVSPAVTSKVAVALPRSPLLPESSHEMEGSVHPNGTDSELVYAPGPTCALNVPPSPIDPLTSPLNENCVGSPDGTVSFFTTIVAALVSVNVQVTVCPAETV